MLKPNKPSFLALGFLAVALSFAATLYYIALLKPSSAVAWGVFAVWLLVPHLAIGAAFAARAVGVVAVVVLLALGQLFLADVIFWQPDPQGGIAVLMLPIFQILGLAVAFLINRLMQSNTRRIRL